MASEVAGPCSEFMVCDLDGDGLQDLVLLDHMKLSIFYQDSTRGFTREPQQAYRLDRGPCVIWTAKLGGPAGSLLVLTSDGVTELCFTNRSDPPSSRRIINQRTILPAVAQTTNGDVMCLPLSARTGRDWPLILVPAADGLHVWEHRDEWRDAQCISNSIDAALRPSLANPGYDTSRGLDLSVGDVNGDGREDLMVRHGGFGWTNTYSLYLQRTNGLFALEPALKCAQREEPHSWLCWTDLNRDGKVDLVKSVWLNEPSFLPGISSGKVLVSTYLADDHGRIPAEPHQIFRKNDWTPELPVVDIDGDGFPDLVLGFSQFDSREGARKQITAKQLDYSLRFYFYRPGTGFPSEADCQRDVVIHLDRAALLLGSAPHQYFERFVRLDGDFNGDGKTDLLVRDHREDISVYFFVSRQKGFSPEPDLRFNCPEEIEGWEAKDLNHDGVSDLIVTLEKQAGLRIFLSQK
jgi:hypothetical protein